MNIHGIGPLYHMSTVATAHRSSKAADFQDGLKAAQKSTTGASNAGTTAETAGKASLSPAFQARALIAGDPTLGEGPFGHLVSEIAKGLPAEEPADPVAVPSTDVATDESADNTDEVDIVV